MKEKRRGQTVQDFLLAFTVITLVLVFLLTFLTSTLPALYFPSSVGENVESQQGIDKFVVEYLSSEGQPQYTVSEECMGGLFDKLDGNSTSYDIDMCSDRIGNITNTTSMGDELNIDSPIKITITDISDGSIPYRYEGTISSESVQSAKRVVVTNENIYIVRLQTR